MAFSHKELIERFGLGGFSQAEQKELLRSCIQLVSERLLPKVLERLDVEDRQRFLVALRKESRPLFEVRELVLQIPEFGAWLEEEIGAVKKIIVQRNS